MSDKSRRVVLRVDCVCQSCERTRAARNTLTRGISRPIRTILVHLRKFRLLDFLKSIKLEENCSNPTASNICKRRLMTCCHLCTCSRFGLSSSSNHRCVIIDQSPYREFYHTYRYYLRAFYHTYRYYLRAHFGQIEIFPGILYI